MCSVITPLLPAIKFLALESHPSGAGHWRDQPCFLMSHQISSRPSCDDRLTSLNSEQIFTFWAKTLGCNLANSLQVDLLHSRYHKCFFYEWMQAQQLTVFSTLIALNIFYVGFYGTTGLQTYRTGPLIAQKSLVQFSQQASSFLLCRRCVYVHCLNGQYISFNCKNKGKRDKLSFWQRATETGGQGV